jgi:hypothetical protein
MTPRLHWPEIRDANGELLSHPDVRAAARLTVGEDYEALLPERDERDFTVL